MQTILTALIVTPLLFITWVAVELAWRRVFGTEIKKSCGTADACGGCCEKRQRTEM